LRAMSTRERHVRVKRLWPAAPAKVWESRRGQRQPGPCRDAAFCTAFQSFFFQGAASYRWASMRKSRNHPLSLPPLELECMKMLWTLGQANVHGIRAGMLASRSLAYTTVMTIMGRLARKGVVERRKQGRFHIYRALVSDIEVRE